MKRIKQGTMYGFDIVIEIPEGVNQPFVIHEHTLHEHIKRERSRAIEEHRCETFTFSYRMVDIKPKKRSWFCRLFK